MPASIKLIDINNEAKALFRFARENCTSDSDVSFFMWSDSALNVLAAIFCGESFEVLDFSDILKNEEIVHLVYFFYLRRLADDRAVQHLCTLERQGLVEHCQAMILGSEEFSLVGRSDFFLNLAPNSGLHPKIFIDVSNTKTTRARTGIQRVVRELVREINVSSIDEVIYIAFSRAENIFKQVLLRDDEFVELNDSNSICFALGDIYFDVDGSWGDVVPRWSLYQKLRQSGIRILNIHYDAAPILFPMYSHPITVLRYLEHFFAASNFSDKLFCISQAVQNDYLKITSVVHGRCAPTTVIPLGNVFSNFEGVNQIIPEDVENLSKSKFVLFVGTVEPRKNYSLLLQNLDHFYRFGLKVVLVGKRGWERNEVIEQLQTAEINGSLIWLKDASDSVLRHLYKTCYLYISTAHYEGYGLPVLEALSYGCAVVTSDGGALAEVGRGYTLSFSLSDSSGLADVLESLETDPQRYERLKFDAANFKAPTWSDTIVKVCDVLKAYMPDNQLYVDWKKAQLVYISIRPESLSRSLASFRKFGHFGPVIVLTSSVLRVQIEEVLAPLGVDFLVLCDEDLFPEETMPSDHQDRNFKLRQRLYENAVIEPLFLSLDDDAILLKSLPSNYYVEQGKYNGYYFYASMSKWCSSPFGVTSYDKGQWRTSRLLRARCYSDKSFSAHQPQLVEKALAQEVYDEYTNCIRDGVDEWSLYFNVCLSRYSNKFFARPVTTLNWPENFSSWMPGWFSAEVYYMNYYSGSNLATDPSLALLNYAASYDKYHAQRLLGGVGKPLKLGSNEDNIVVGLPKIWVDIEIKDTYSDVGYQIFSGDQIVVNGTMDRQNISLRSPLKVLMPDKPGEYRLTFLHLDSKSEMATALLLVFPWRSM
jgi:glycosyltransferase involved in cell wall biosynthesis